MTLNADIEQSLLQKITKCISSSKLDTCVTVAVQLIGSEVAPEDVWGILELARTRIMQAQYDFGYVISLAVAKSLPQGQGPVKPYYYAAISAHKLGKLSEAKDYYQKTIALEPIYQISVVENGRLKIIPSLDNRELSQLYHNFAVLFYELGDVAQAEEDYRNAIHHDINNAASHNDLANILVGKLGQENEAEDHYLKAIALGLTTSYFNYANFLSKLGRMTEAESNYKSAIKLTPNDSKPNNNYAMLLEKKGREKEAETHYKKAIELDPKNIAARNNYANLLRRKQRFSEAESEMRIALELDPDNAYLLGTFGDILADEGNLQEAERILRKALFAFNSIEQNAISQTHNSLGSVYGELKEYNKAKREFIRAIGFDYQNVKAIRNLRKVNSLLGEELKSFPSKMFTNVKSVTIGPTGIGITFERESINRMIPSKIGPTIAINLER